MWEFRCPTKPATCSMVFPKAGCAGGAGVMGMGGARATARTRSRPLGAPADPSRTGGGWQLVCRVVWGWTCGPRTPARVAMAMKCRRTWLGEMGRSGWSRFGKRYTHGDPLGCDSRRSFTHRWINCWRMEDRP